MLKTEKKKPKRRVYFFARVFVVNELLFRHQSEEAN